MEGLNYFKDHSDTQNKTIQGYNSKQMFGIILIYLLMYALMNFNFLLKS